MTHMSWIMSLAIGTCMVIVVGGIVIGLWLLLIGRMGQGKHSAKSRSHSAELDKRVAELERRLTDTQDIVLSISEKLDRLEPTTSEAVSHTS